MPEEEDQTTSEELVETRASIIAQRIAERFPEKFPLPGHLELLTGIIIAAMREGERDAVAL